MKLAVTDANVFIDLLQLEIIELLFQIDLQIITTREVIEELWDEQQTTLKHFQERQLLTIAELNNEELDLLQSLNFNRGLSYTDQTAITLSLSKKAILLTGDLAVRKFCKARNIEVRGVLWLFDMFVENQVLTSINAKKNLELLMKINSRLPTEECEERLKKWES